MAGITAAVIGAGTAIYSAKKQASAQNKALKAAENAQKAADPYADYRAGAASQLNAMSQSGYNPNFTGINQGLAGLQQATANATNRDNMYAPVQFSAGDTSVGTLNDYVAPYKDAILEASLQGAQRQSAAQGYTGSGNALIAAAQAGRESAMYSYQLAGIDQASARESKIAGANLGMQANQLYAQQLMNANDNMLQQSALGMQGAAAYLNAMYQNEGMLADAYNNRFNQLAMLSGANVGLQTAAGISGNVSSGQQNVGAGYAGLGQSVGTGLSQVVGAIGDKGWFGGRSANVGTKVGGNFK